jgi:hypothetical protein
VGDHCYVCCAQCRKALSARLDGEESAAELILRVGSGPGWRDDQPQDSDVRAVLAAARWCGCPCCRRLTGLLRLSP